MQYRFKSCYYKWEDKEEKKTLEKGRRLQMDYLLCTQWAAKISAEAVLAEHWAIC